MTPLLGLHPRLRPKDWRQWQWHTLSVEEIGLLAISVACSYHFLLAELVDYFHKLWNTFQEDQKPEKFAE